MARHPVFGRMKQDYLRSRQRRGRGRWFHYYRRGGKEVSLGVHGLHPTDKRVFAAYCAAHARYETQPKQEETAKGGTFRWGLDIYKTSDHWLRTLSEGSRESREDIFNRYLKKQGDRPLLSITQDNLETALIAKGGWGAVNELKALKPVFKHLKKMKIIPRDIAAGIKLDKPKSKGFPTASADEIERYIKRWPRGTVQRLIFDLALTTGAARVDLVKLGPQNITGDILTYRRQKTGEVAEVPVTKELRAAIAHLPDIAPAFLLKANGKPYARESIGNMFASAAKEVDMVARIHGLRKALCVYWAEQGASVHQIAAMAGHSSLSEVERYTKAVDRKRIVQLLIEGA